MIESKEKNQFYSNDLCALGVKNLKKKKCNVLYRSKARFLKHSSACKSDRVTADVFFLLDASHWVTKNDLKHILDFVKSFVDSFIYGPDNVRVGMTPYSGGGHMMIHFTQFRTREILYYRLNYIQYNGG